MGVLTRSVAVAAAAVVIFESMDSYFRLHPDDEAPDALLDPENQYTEPWGGGKWHLEIFRSINPEPEDWNGEM